MKQRKRRLSALHVRFVFEWVTVPSGGLPERLLLQLLPPALLLRVLRSLAPPGPSS